MRWTRSYMRCFATSASDGRSGGMPHAPRSFEGSSSPAAFRRLASSSSSTHILSAFSGGRRSSSSAFFSARIARASPRTSRAEGGSTERSFSSFASSEGVEVGSGTPRVSPKCRRTSPARLRAPAFVMARYRVADAFILRPSRAPRSTRLLAASGARAAPQLNGSGGAAAGSSSSSKAAPRVVSSPPQGTSPAGAPARSASSMNWLGVRRWRALPPPSPLETSAPPRQASAEPSAEATSSNSDASSPTRRRNSNARDPSAIERVAVAGARRARGAVTLRSNFHLGFINKRSLEGLFEMPVRIPRATCQWVSASKIAGSAKRRGRYSSSKGFLQSRARVSAQRTRAHRPAAVYPSRGQRARLLARRARVFAPPIPSLLSRRDPWRQNPRTRSSCM